MQILIVVLLSAMVFPESVFAEETAPVPHDVPPVIALAKASKLTSKTERSSVDGLYQIELTIPEINYKKESKTIRMGKTAVWDELQVTTEPASRVLVFESASQIADSRIVDVDGNSIPWNILLERLNTKTSVLVSVSGKMVDPYYLSVVKRDVILILLSRKDGMGNVKYLPGRIEDRGITEIGVADPKGVLFDRTSGFLPIEIKSAQEITKYFSEQQRSGLGPIDFDQEYLLVFSWGGSGGDRLEYLGSGLEDRKVTFLKRPGVTKDLRSHTKVYRIDADVEWELATVMTP